MYYLSQKIIEQIYIVLVLIRPLTADPLAARAAEDLGKGQQGQGVRSRSMAEKEERPRPSSKNRVQLLGFELFLNQSSSNHNQQPTRSSSTWSTTYSRTFRHLPLTKPLPFMHYRF
jgi:hypothetical protein